MMVSKLILRDVEENDLNIFFEYQLDPDANHMAAFAAKDPTDRSAFDAQWENILEDETISVKAIVFEGQVVGRISMFQLLGKPSISYWIGKAFWNKGIATQALTQFLKMETTRPIYARAAKDNLASIRVLEKCGFDVIATDKAFANARQAEIEEVVLERTC